MSAFFSSSRTPRWLAAVVAAAAVATPAQAADYPSKPITLVMTFSAGSGVDVVARHIQGPLERELGQPIVIDYKTGAAGNIASEYVSRAKPDGYTLEFGTAATHGVNAALYDKLPFDVEDDFVPVAPVIDVSNVLTVNPAVMDVSSLEEFVREVKSNPGKYNFASTGNGTGTHMAFAELNHRLGLDMVHVPYRGGPDAILSVVRGDTCCIMNQVQTVLSHAKEGNVRLLAVTTAQPVAAVPDVPPIADSGLPGAEGFDSSIWFAIFAPKGTDAAIVEQLNAAVQKVLQEPAIKQKMEDAGNAIRLEDPAQFKQTVRDNRIKWAEVVKAAGITIQ